MSITKKFRVEKGSDFRLKDYDPAVTLGVKSKKQALYALEEGTLQLSTLQDRLFARDCWALLVILQAMDGAGKDSTIKHVMSGVNPQACQVTAFKVPSAEELDHDFLWRAVRNLPPRGRIGIFNRSYYEEVLVVKVHPELLEKQKLPPGLVTKNIWEQRYKDINAFERYLRRNGIITLKFYLNLSKKEQKKRFLKRLEEPEKNWKFSAADVAERQCWDDYMDAYEQMIQNTATECAPWYVVPADHKWVTRLIVAKAIVETLEALQLEYPKVGQKERKELEAARRALEHENGQRKRQHEKTNKKNPD
ncbi:MAG TPA: polyphosphate kinase 2 family protein [Candidatus Dormibacteraeota bacterium]|nr:polyphosphate kinase 2 family protein [Candidatus Dormibacteraeota bacterium]